MVPLLFYKLLAQARELVSDVGYGEGRESGTYGVAG